MFAINHAATGALIGLTATNPAVAVPVALLSHFVCDAIPHYGKDDANYLRSRQFILMLIADAVLCGLLVLLLAMTAPKSWLIAAVCAFVAAAPDFAWIPKFKRALRRQPSAKPGLYSRFAIDIQWFQRPLGIVVELTWFIGAVTLLMAYLLPI